MLLRWIVLIQITLKYLKYCAFEFLPEFLLLVFVQCSAGVRTWQLKWSEMCQSKSHVLNEYIIHKIIAVVYHVIPEKIIWLLFLSLNNNWLPLPYRSIPSGRIIDSLSWHCSWGFISMYCFVLFVGFFPHVSCDFVTCYHGSFCKRSFQYQNSSWECEKAWKGFSLISYGMLVGYSLVHLLKDRKICWNMPVCFPCQNTTYCI